MSTLKLEKITGQEGLGGAASPITFSGDTATLGSGVTFPAGMIIQVKSTQSSTYLATGSSYVDAFTDLSLTTSGANKILITGIMNGVVMFDSAGFIRFNLTDGTDIIQTLTTMYAAGSNSADDPYGSFSFQYMTGVLSASTTYTYNVQFKNNQGSNSARLSGDGNSLRTLTLMEIAE